MEKPLIQVIAPATTANLGPGYDCLGLALDLWNWLEVTEIPQASGNKPQVEVAGEGAGQGSDVDLIQAHELALRDRAQHGDTLAPDRGRDLGSEASHPWLLGKMFVGAATLILTAGIWRSIIQSGQPVTASRNEKSPSRTLGRRSWYFWDAGLYYCHPIQCVVRSTGAVDQPPGRDSYTATG